MMSERYLTEEETKRHHFLFHVFRMDKAANPMPPGRVNTLLHCLKCVYLDKTKKEKGRK